ncbi:hypothetical protein [Bacteroides ovatus]|uniref:hypothetical protein n=1 Tax=Bacteroides ovatus TaxID=28116 RepID=UPI002030E56D|nr:hypothetical protein [Bacteroides ovatus]MCM1722611.1 hypothetical protein [Bacteroides ovatus]MCM1758988.1 hypothetical protein [Bacteroides ovatus]MCM1869045.1 hypothetical protein [Bacteroides ovatus]MCM1912446.1 hypothetical protein [Bacteroides ovatus]
METVVASIIFMIVFGIAMDILTRIVISNHKDNENLIIESAFSKCKREIKRKGLTVGSETYTFAWGEIQINTSECGNELFKIEMNATTNEKKRVSYRYILTQKDFDE